MPLTFCHCYQTMGTVVDQGAAVPVNSDRAKVADLWREREGPRMANFERSRTVPCFASTDSDAWPRSRTS